MQNTTDYSQVPNNAKYPTEGRLGRLEIIFLLTGQTPFQTWDSLTGAHQNELQDNILDYISMVTGKALRGSNNVDCSRTAVGFRHQCVGIVWRTPDAEYVWANPRYPHSGLVTSQNVKKIISEAECPLSN